LVVAVSLTKTFLIAAYRKLKALALLLADVTIGHQRPFLQRLIAEIIPAISIILIVLLIGSFSKRILPAPEMVVMLLVAAAILAALLWRPFVRLHTRLQVALFDTLREEADEKA